MPTLPELYQQLRNSLHGIPDPRKHDLCCYPFMQVLITANGKYRPCCKYTDYLTDKGELLDVRTHTAGEAWNADSMQRLRDKMRQGERDSGCAECWKEEAAGIRSMRYDSYQYPVTRRQLEQTEAPLRVEINASNVCNLKCRICSSWASTKWIAEEQALYGYAEQKHINLTPENLEVIRGWLPHLKEIGLFGGEPLLSEENLDLLRYCVSSGHARHLTLLLNTNTTVYTDEIAALFRNFKKVYLNFSVDDIGDRFEYERKGAKWTDSVAVIRKFLEHGGVNRRSRIVCKVNLTVSNLNVYYLPEFFEYFNAYFPGMPVYFNLLYNPAAYSIRNLPGPVKAQIAERLGSRVKTSFRAHEQYTRTTGSVIRFMNGEPEAPFADFFSMTGKHDQYRQEKFQAVFPEFWALIRAYQPEPASPAKP